MLRGTAMGLVWAIVGALALLTGTPVARAQAHGGALSLSLGRDVSTERLRRADFERAIGLLALSEEQLRDSRGLYEGYTASYREALRVQDEAYKALSQRLRAGEPEALQRAQSLVTEFEAKAASLNKGLLDDLRAVIDETQVDRWAALERMLRRSAFRGQSVVSGAGVDLRELTRELRLEGSIDAMVGPILAEYETGLDSHIMAWNRVMSESMRGPFESERDSKAMTELREIGLLARGTNERYQRLIEAVLSAEDVVRLRARVEETGYRRVSRWALDVIDAALSIEGITPEQEATIRGIRVSYLQRIAPLNQAWIGAIRGWEESRAFMVVGRGKSNVLVDLEPDAKEAAAQKARTDVDRETTEKVRAVLRKEQLESLTAAYNAKHLTFSGDE